MRPTDPDRLLEIGRVARAHGVHGEVKVVPDMHDPYHFDVLETVYLGATPETARPVAIIGARFQQVKKGLVAILTFEGVETRDQAEALRGLTAYATRDDLPPLEEGEFFLHELIGLAVVTRDGDAIGTIKDVLELPGHPVYVVARDGQPDAMIPAVPAFIDGLDFEQGRVVVHVIEGLFD